MTVTHTVASLDASKGGPSRSVPALARELERQGVEVRLHAWDDGSDPPGEPDLIHDHGIWLPTNHRAARLAGTLGIPRVVSLRGMLEPWAMRHRRWKKRVAWHLFQRRDLQQATLIHVTSEAEAEGVRRMDLTIPTAVIPNGVELPPTRPVGGERGTRRALFLSRLHPVKGLPALIEAWATIRPANWQLVLAGPDEDGHRAELERQMSAHRLNGAVSCVGPVDDDDKWTWYENADLFVLPSHGESFGLVIAEALASGLPVITTKDTPWEELESHRCGWWVDAEVDALASALREATSLSSSERNAMGERGRRLVEERYCWDRIARRMRDVYEWILHDGPIPPTVRFP